MSYTVEIMLSISYFLSVVTVDLAKYNQFMCMYCIKVTSK